MNEIATNENPSTHNTNASVSKMRESIEKFIVDEKSRASSRPPQKALPDPKTYKPTNSKSDLLQPTKETVKKNESKENGEQNFSLKPRKVSVEDKKSPIYQNGKHNGEETKAEYMLEEDLLDDDLDEKYAKKPLPLPPISIPTIQNHIPVDSTSLQPLPSPKIPPKPKNIQVRTSVVKTVSEIKYIVPSKRPPSTKEFIVENWRKKHEKRTKIVNEIHDTEKFYLECIVSMVEIYKAAFVEKNIPKDKTDKIFSNVEEIVSLSSTLLNQISSKLLNWDINSTVGEIFVDMGPKFEPYTVYIKNHEEAIKTLAQLEKKKEFVSFLKKVEDVNKNVRALHNLLIMPVQRLPKYELLLGRLKESTDEKHPDFTLIEQGFVAVTSVTVRVDETIKREENLQKIYGIQKKLGVQDIISENRTYVMDGLLTKICRKVPKKRWFILFTDLLIYSEPDITAKLTQPRRHELGNILVVDIPDSEDFVHAFQISSLQKSFIVFANTQKEKYEWMKELNRYATCATENTEDSARAPVWIPDKNHGECMGCRSKFSILNRRHHCRKCGKLVCGSCSQYRMVLEHLGTKPVRVCQECSEGGNVASLLTASSTNLDLTNQQANN